METAWNFMAGGAALGLIAGLWGHIKNIGWKLASLFVERVEAVDFVLLVSDLERRAGIEAVHRHGGLPSGIAGTRNGCAECNL